MTDYEMLALVALASGIAEEFRMEAKSFGGKAVPRRFCNDRQDFVDWNPLADDADGARLEASLKLNVTWSDNSVTVDHPGNALAKTTVSFPASSPADARHSARRQAAMFAAVEIGLAMKASASLGGLAP
jgi:hypothetical protein